MAYVSSSGLAAPLGASLTGTISRLTARLAAAWAARRAAAEERRAIAEVMAISCPCDRSGLMAEYEIAATRQRR
jgi:hypothetical protein